MGDPLSMKKIGNHPNQIVAQTGNHGLDCFFNKKDDLRYGTNPSQTAALYNPLGFLGSLKEHKTGKEGPSQTNIEDIFYAAVTVGYFAEPSVIIMKHENASGFATQYEPEPLCITYKKARDCDFRAGFGGTVLTNRHIDMETAEVMRELFTEVLVAPGYDEGVISKFKGSIRIFEYDENKFIKIPRYEGDECPAELKILPDSKEGTPIRSDVYLSPVRTLDDLRAHVASTRQPTEMELRDLLTGYRIRLRSNSVRMVKNGYTTGLGTGQQDRVMCIDIAAYKNRKLAELAAKENIMRAADYSIPRSVLVSDGFFPFTDSIELAHELGITAVLAPHGGKNFEKVLAKTDELGIAFVDLPGDWRFFDHH